MNNEYEFVWKGMVRWLHNEVLWRDLRSHETIVKAACGEVGIWNENRLGECRNSAAAVSQVSFDIRLETIVQIWNTHVLLWDTKLHSLYFWHTREAY
jgi:hypothetical protein